MMSKAADLMGFVEVPFALRSPAIFATSVTICLKPMFYDTASPIMGNCEESFQSGVKKMGLKMPVHAYYSAKGHKSVRDEEDSGWNIKSQEKLDKFFNFVAHPLVRKISLKQVVYNNQLDLSEIDWRAQTIFEIDIEYRPRLAELIDVMGKHGTMVVPDMSHLTDGNAYCRRVIDLFSDCAIAPVSVADVENRIDRLEPYLRRPLRELRRTPRFLEDVELFFQEAANSGVNNRDQLKNYLAHTPKELARSFR